MFSHLSLFFLIPLGWRKRGPPGEQLNLSPSLPPLPMAPPELIRRSLAQVGLTIMLPATVIQPEMAYFAPQWQSEPFRVVNSWIF